MTNAESHFKNELFKSGYAEMNIPVAKYPVIPEYEPSSGAFMVKPLTAPWIVGLEQKQWNKYCASALLNESLITRAGRKDRTRFLLSTMRCIEMRLRQHKRPRLIAGCYFLDLNGYHEQIIRINKRHVYPCYDKLDVTLADWPIILELEDDIVFNSYVQPLDLVTNGSIRIDDWSFATVGWNHRKYYSPQYAIPLQAEQSKFWNDANIKLDEVSTIVTQRLYHRNDNIISNM
uniref:Uncharacterized protein n=1 Tax=Romanomermis culicivorax TaxID=13658 RepID=A0A915II15_ROMCU